MSSSGSWNSKPIAAQKVPYNWKNTHEIKIGQLPSAWLDAMIGFQFGVVQAYELNFFPFGDGAFCRYGKRVPGRLRGRLSDRTRIRLEWDGVGLRWGSPGPEGAVLFLGVA